MRYIKLLSIVLFFSYILQLNKIELQLNENKQNYIQETSYNYCDIQSNVSVMCNDTEQESMEDILTYHFETNFIVKELKSTGEAKLLNYNVIDSNHINVIIKVPNGNSSVTLEFASISGEIELYSLYFSQNDKGEYFSSNLSADVVKRKANQAVNYSTTVVDEEIVCDENENLCISPMSIGVVGSVSGTLRWTDDQNNIHPLIGAKVKVTISGSWWSKSTYTDELGNYAISYNDIWYIGSGKPKVHIYSDGESVCVSNNGVYEMSHEFNGSSGDFIYSYTFSPIADGDIGRAMHIFQAGYNYSNYIKKLNNEISITKCNFNYPSNPSNGCYYDGNNNVYITSRTNLAGYPTSYASWDVIGHEYGHHVQKCFGISDNPGGTHFINHNLIDDQYDAGYFFSAAKDRGMRLAWAEGWPTFWSTVAQTTFPDDIRTINTVGDLNYSTYRGFDYDIDTYVATTNGLGVITGYLGDADEIAITSILYKLYSKTTDSYDLFSISDSDLWNITKQVKPKYFYQFLQGLYDEGYNRNDLGKLLGRYNVAVSDVSIENNYLDECPTFKWSTYMGSSNLYYDSFDLVFLNPRGQEVLRKNNIAASGEQCEYTLSRSEWSEIISIYGRTYYVYIVARQTLSFSSGDYYSELFEFYEPDDFNRKVQIKPNEWGFEPQYFFESNKEGHTSTTITDHGLTITTNRLRCGYIENSYVVLSPKRQNAGVAYLEMTFDQPVYSYMFGITLWSNNEGLSSADCTAVVEVMDADGDWSLDWDLFRDLPNGFSVRTQQIDRYETACRKGIYGIRFVMTAPATGDRNKGRLCIDDIVLNTDPNDLWFISTFYA